MSLLKEKANKNTPSVEPDVKASQVPTITIFGEEQNKRSTSTTMSSNSDIPATTSNFSFLQYPYEY